MQPLQPVATGFDQGRYPPPHQRQGAFQMFTKLGNQTTTKQHCQLWFLHLLLSPTCLSLASLAVSVFPNFSNHPPLHHSCCSGSWIDPAKSAVPHVSRLRILKVQMCSRYHGLLHSPFWVCGTSRQTPQCLKQKVQKHESCSRRSAEKIGKGESLSFHETLPLDSRVS